MKFSLSWLREYLETNKQISRAAQRGELIELLGVLATENRQLDIVNVATALHRSAKLRSVPAATFRFLAAELAAGRGRCHPRCIGSMLYGLKERGHSPATEAVLAALAPKIVESRAQLDAQAVGNDIKRHL